MDAMAKPVGGEGKTFADYLSQSSRLGGNDWDMSNAVVGAQQRMGADQELNRKREIDRAKFLSAELNQDEVQMDKLAARFGGQAKSPNAAVSAEKVNEIYGRTMSQTMTSLRTGNPDMPVQQMLEIAKQAATSVTEDYVKRFAVGREDAQPGVPKAPIKFDSQNMSFKLPVGMSEMQELTKLALQVKANKKLLRDPSTSAAAKEASEGILRSIHDKYGVATPTPTAMPAVPTPVAKKQLTSGFSPWTNIEPVSASDVPPSEYKNKQAEYKNALEATGSEKSKERLATLRAEKEVLNSVLNLDVNTDKLTAATTLGNQWLRSLGVPSQRRVWEAGHSRTTQG